MVQVAICIGFLSAATLLGQSLLAFGFERYGLPAEETLIAQIYFGYADEVEDPDAPLTDAEREAIRLDFMVDATRKREMIREAALHLPGVRLAAFGSRFPGNESETEHIAIQGLDLPAELAEVVEIGPDYIELIDAGAVQGRVFTPDEHADGPPVVLVNEPFVRERLGGVNAVGRRVRVVPAEATNPDSYDWATIVGVVPDLGLNPGNPAHSSGVYRPLGDASIMRLALRGDAAPSTWAPGLIEIARRIDPTIQVQWTRTLADQMREPVAIFRGMGFGFLVMGALVLLLSSASIHALTACTVSRRSRELGIRQALGAGAGRIVHTVLRRSAIQLGVGALLGTGLALGLLQLASTLPWEVRQTNPAAIALVVGVLTLSGVAALAQPLRRALSIRPADAMRSE